MAESAPENISLDALLELAATGDPTYGTSFYKALLGSEIFLALKPNFTTELPLVGISSIESLGTVLVDYGSEQFVPIFTSQELADLWRGDTQPCRQIAFSSLLQLLSDELWLYLNPGPGTGKEFTPWEVSLLKKGEEAIPEIVSEIFDETPPDLELEREWQDSPDFIARVRSAAESYPGVAEVFIVGLREEEGEVFSPVIGVKHHGLSSEKLTQLVEELRDLAATVLSAEYHAVIVPNVDDRRDPRSAFFRNIKPIYFAQRPLEQISDGLLSRLRNRFLTPKNSNSDEGEG